MYKDQIMQNLTTEQQSASTNRWETIKNSIKNAAEKVIGFKRKPTK